MLGGDPPTHKQIAYLRLWHLRLYAVVIKIRLDVRSPGFVRKLLLVRLATLALPDTAAAGRRRGSYGLRDAFNRMNADHMCSCTLRSKAVRQDAVG